MHYSSEENEDNGSPGDMSKEDDDLLTDNDYDVFVFVQDKMTCNMNKESGIPRTGYYCTASQLWPCCKNDTSQECA